jgi:hypothetical protein
LNSGCEVFENILHSGGKHFKLCCEVWPVDYKLRKKLLITKIEVWRRAGGTFKMLKVINGVIREDVRVMYNCGMNGK